MYTRKRKHIQQGPRMNNAALTGYTSIARFQPVTSERPTRLWEPHIDANDFLIKLVKRQTKKPLLLTITGFTDQGKEIYYQTTITRNYMKNYLTRHYQS